MGANPKKVRRWKKREARSKRYSIVLEDGFVIVVGYLWKPGMVLKFAVILMKLRTDTGEWDEICRYDTAHGFAHLDILDENRKVINKIPMSGSLSYKEAVTYAIDDLKENFQKYWKDYCTRQKQNGRA
jgi:hypothetical protein